MVILDSRGDGKREGRGEMRREMSRMRAEHMHVLLVVFHDF